MSKILMTLFTLCVTVWAQSEAFCSDICVPPQGSFPCSVIPVEQIRKRDDYWYTQGVGAHKLHVRLVTWNDARNTCADEGGHLAIINSKAEAMALVGIFNSTGPIKGAHDPNQVWVGIHDLYNEGEFVTIHGDPLASTGFTNWAVGQPDNAGGVENCGSLFSSGQLNDFQCARLQGFFCELRL